MMLDKPQTRQEEVAYCREAIWYARFITPDHSLPKYFRDNLAREIATARYERDYPKTIPHKVEFIGGPRCGDIEEYKVLDEIVIVAVPDAKPMRLYMNMPEMISIRRFTYRLRVHRTIKAWRITERLTYELA